MAGRRGVRGLRAPGDLRGCVDGICRDPDAFEASVDSWNPEASGDLGLDGALDGTSPQGESTPSSKSMAAIERAR